MNLDAVIDRYLLHLQTHWSHATWSTARYRLKPLRAKFGTCQLTDVTNQDMLDLMLQLEKRGLASATLAGYRSTVRAFWNWAANSNLINHAPITLLRQRRYSYAPQTALAAPADALTLLLDSLDSFAAHRNNNPRDMRDSALISMTADSGKRRGELWMLHWRQLSRVLATEADIYTCRSRGKQNAATLHFSTATARRLRAWHAASPYPNGWVWCNLRTGERLRDDSLRIAFRRACAFADVDCFLFQAVRKRTVTDVVELTGNVRDGQLLAGHTTPRVTLAHYIMADEKNVGHNVATLAHKRGNI